MRHSTVWTGVALAAMLAGCQVYRDLATRGSNAFHEIQIEVAPDVRKQAAIENLKVERKAHAGASFVVTGDSRYAQPCKSALMLSVSFINEKGVILSSHPATVRAYPGAVTARFASSAYINAKIGETQDIIDKIVINDLRCV